MCVPTRGAAHDLEAAHSLRTVTLSTADAELYVRHGGGRPRETIHPAYLGRDGHAERAENAQ